LQTLYLKVIGIGGQDVGNIDDLVSLVNATMIDLQGSINMSCAELTTLIEKFNGTLAVVLPKTAIANGPDKNCTGP